MARKITKKEEHISSKAVKKCAPVEAAPEQYFILPDGRQIKSVEQLALMMDQIKDEDFSFHVNEEKNDFANWIRDVFGKEDLADKLVELKCKKENQIELLKHSVGSR